MKILKSKKVDIFTISVGNIEVGGVGKTPFVIFLANKIKKKIGVISRGYKSKREKRNTIISKDILDEKKFLAEDIGDEPFLLSSRINGYLFVGRDKIKSAFLAKKMGLDIVILDDGFQSRYIKKDLEIVVLNGKNIFKKKYFLPRGFLRDSFKRLKDADFIVVNNIDKNLKILKKK